MNKFNKEEMKVSNNLSTMVILPNTTLTHHHIQTWKLFTKQFISASALSCTFLRKSEFDFFVVVRKTFTWDAWKRI
ncbi:hypothetical protein AQUCO_02800192v1 [Aquilegia coerulea]|uniref:Uncharacterized protein n=1 Tax=Aquilegia coerulea TaxID=218851 RepID=A0A2G5D556_AQUCA|nr:hypothetical protein AQUCO_02800192v1 [Aquilegia coerulea]